MYLLDLQIRSAGGGSQFVFVWVDDADAARAEVRARELARKENWSVASIESVVETNADDYFRVCPSQRAFVRAQREGIAWRVNEIEEEPDGSCDISSG